MRWALKRQFLIAIAVIVVIGLVALGLWFVFLYRSPSCSDNVQNQGETGVDCSGPCARLCEVPTVTALWARSVEVAPGVYHAVALVQNPRTDAGTASLPYTFDLYDSSNILVAERSGAMYLNPGEVVPLFEPNITTGNRVPIHAFVSFGPSVWQKMDRTSVPVSVTSQSLDSQALKLTAHLENTSPVPVPAFTVTALLYDAGGNLVTASQTAIDGLAARGGKDIVFTWQEPFSAPVIRADIVPRLLAQ
jgi:hypothetical protein